MKKKLNCVLLVDDDESDNFFHKRILEKAGICNHVEIALNGKEAIDFLVRKNTERQSETPYSQPELVFLDINMPVMDGWEFLEIYQKLVKIREEKPVFIILSTSINPADKLKAEKLICRGCFEFKPLTLEMIHRILQVHFPGYL